MLLYINALQNCQTTHWLYYCKICKFRWCNFLHLANVNQFSTDQYTKHIWIFFKIFLFLEKLNGIREKLNRIRIWSEYAIYLYSRNNQNLFLILSGTGSFIGQYNNILGFITMAAGCSHVNVWYMYIWMMIYVCFIMWP